MNEKKQLYWMGGTFAVLFLMYLLSGRIEPTPSATLAGISLPTADGKATVDLGRCKTEKCLNIYVSPWCHICRRSTGFINELKVYLAGKGVETRVIVGRGELDEVRGYAPDFGPDALLDETAAFPLSGGVPNFTVSNSKGEVLKVVPGVPGIYEPPIPESIMVQMEQYLGLI